MPRDTNDDEDLFERDTGKSADVGAPNSDEDTDPEEMYGAADEGFEEDKELFEGDE
jgi:hypothetical protein